MFVMTHYYPNFSENWNIILLVFYIIFVFQSEFSSASTRESRSERPMNALLSYRGPKNKVDLWARIYILNWSHKPKLQPLTSNLKLLSCLGPSSVFFSLLFCKNLYKKRHLKKCFIYIYITRRKKKKTRRKILVQTNDYANI